VVDFGNFQHLKYLHFGVIDDIFFSKTANLVALIQRGVQLTRGPCAPERPIIIGVIAVLVRSGGGAGVAEVE
jgi:hypothetical protein